MAAPAKKEGTKKESALYNLSRYIRVYLGEDGDTEGETRGIIISGYRTDSEGNRQYCNIWIDKDFAIKNRHDGAYTLMLKMVEKEIKE